MRLFHSFLGFYDSNGIMLYVCFRNNVHLFIAHILQSAFLVFCIYHCSQYYYYGIYLFKKYQNFILMNHKSHGKMEGI